MMILNRLLPLCLLLAGATTLSAQNNPTREVTIPAGQELDIIRNFIIQDSTDNGLDVIENTRYLLERGETYVYTTQWQPLFSVNLGATDGDGARPRIIGLAPDAGEAPRFFRSVASFDVRDLWFEGFDTGGTHTDNAPIRPRGANQSFYVENCYFPDQRQEIARIDADRVTLRMMNNIFENNYTVDNWAKNGGIMVQRGQIDTVIMHNNTYYNSPGRVTRNWTLDANYVAFTHNTVVGVGGLAEPGVLGNKPFYDATLEFGITRNLVVQNNILYNVAFFGTTEAWKDEQGLFGFIGTDSTESVVISNNNIWTDPDLLDGTPDTAFQMPFFTSSADTFFNAQAPDGMTGEEWIRDMNISEELTFNNPILNVDLFEQLKEQRWSDPSNYAFSNLDLPTHSSIEELDYGYSETAESATAGTEGQALGSARWMDIISRVNRYTVNQSRLNLAGNFPNPVGSFTNIRVDLASAATVEVAIYDLHGRILDLRRGLRLPAGSDQLIRLDNIRLPGGAYAYTVVAQMGSARYGATGRMVVR